MRGKKNLTWNQWDHSWTSQIKRNISDVEKVNVAFFLLFHTGDLNSLIIYAMQLSTRAFFFLFNLASLGLMAKLYLFADTHATQRNCCYSIKWMHMCSMDRSHLQKRMLSAHWTETQFMSSSFRQRENPFKSLSNGVWQVWHDQSTGNNGTVSWLGNYGSGSATGLWAFIATNTAEWF